MDKRKKPRSNNYWGAIILDWFDELNRLNLSRSDYKTMFYILSQIESTNNTAHVKQNEIAKNLGMDKGNVSRSIKNLIDLQFVMKLENGFIVNPHLFYVGKGKTEAREKIRSYFDEILKDAGKSPVYYMDEEQAILDVSSESSRMGKSQYESKDSPF